ncbi:CPBP family intramembrane metalloprotease [Nibribacter ruber]|uniref:CPBP family intramembrane metalloprotease n=1 Tax=Nibribacter ruber TaxID=2698458 RepID=A0A6P1P1A3_9BACT|nr:CPBP family intramembrane glutamic endopeptidase [Nibribacter ruber]QHL88311.1 CPBP family intramembrane metalloprotease [Nibribacter ruber]
MKGFIHPRLHPFVSLLLLTVFVIAGLFVGMFLAMVVNKALYGYGMMQMTEILQSPTDFPEGRQAMLLYQAITHLGGFTLGTLAFLKFNAQAPFSFLSPRTHVPAGLLLMSALLIVLIMPANSWLIEWNVNFKFPEFLRAFEQDAKATEERLRVLTEYLTRFETVGSLIFGLVVVAVIPAIGEELVFRGVAQQELARWFKNPHVGIWLAAFLFGAVHFQFYGFFPRMALGAVLGYLYLWSKNIWVPIVGHFMNNGFTVLFLYLHQRGTVDVEIESTEAMPWYWSLGSVVLSGAVLYVLQKGYNQVSQPAVNEDRF